MKIISSAILQGDQVCKIIKCPNIKLLRLRALALNYCPIFVVIKASYCHFSLQITHYLTQTFSTSVCGPAVGLRAPPSGSWNQWQAFIVVVHFERLLFLKPSVSVSFFPVFVILCFNGCLHGFGKVVIGFILPIIGGFQISLFNINNTLTSY